MDLTWWFGNSPVVCLKQKIYNNSTFRQTRDVGRSLHRIQD